MDQGVPGVSCASRGTKRAANPKILLSQTEDWRRETYVYDPGPTEPTDAHGHAEIQLSYSSHYAGYYQVGARRIEFLPGQWVMIPAWVGHACHGYQDRIEVSRFTVIHLTLGRPLASSLSTGHFGALPTLLSNEPASVEDMLLGLIKADLPMRDPRAFSQVIAWVRAQPRSWPRTSELALALGYSPRHLFRLVRTMTGLSPSQWIRSIKMDQATEALRRGESVRKVADDLGFFDDAHLRRAFRRAHGFPASQLRS